MPVYRYIAMSSPTETQGKAAPGERRTGELAADSEAQVRAALRRMGLSPVSLRLARASRPRNNPRNNPRPRSLSWPRSGQIPGATPLTGAEPGASEASGLLPGSGARRLRSRGAVVEWCESLSTLLAAGTELSAALDLLAPRAERPSSRLLYPLRALRRDLRIGTLSRSMAERVRAGGSLSEAMAERPDWFGPIEVALVDAAERSGGLDTALAGLAEDLSRADEVRSRIAGALAYPALLALVGVGVAVFLSTVTLPQVAGVLADSGVPLPAPTRALMAFGSILAGWWFLAIPLAALLIAASITALRVPRLAASRLRIPLVGKAALRAQTASACALLARLLDAGLPLADALPLAAGAASNQAIRAELLSIAESLRRGRTLAASTGRVFEPVVRRVLEVREESGELASGLRTLADRQRRSARRLADRLAAALEPAAVLLLAAGVGFVAYAAIAPMLRLAQTF